MTIAVYGIRLCVCIQSFFFGGGGDNLAEAVDRLLI